ncbi:MAG: hypothetical protein WDN26_20940 [Chitinophagaceae bacterium]
MLSSEQNPEECDATGDDSSTTAGLIKELKKNRHPGNGAAKISKMYELLAL